MYLIASRVLNWLDEADAEREHALTQAERLRLAPRIAILHFAFFERA
jgi:hypothetical protein